MSDAARGSPTCFEYQQDESAKRRQDLTPDVLDRLIKTLRANLQTDAEDRPSQFHIWPCITIVETTLGDHTAIWSPQSSSIRMSTARYQMLPYFASYHWQLAVFDQSQHVVARYDSAWQHGTDRFTFTVLQKWFLSHGGNSCQSSYEYTMVKTTPVPENAHNTGIVVWWVAKQLIRGGNVDGLPADWECERSLAMESLREDSDFDVLVNYD
ncbi:hypothetical protein LTR87_015070 [Friedmanniomyces endolithicus]|nr:hypothetical protein LTR87_015070 [Friedmanniomyces endolithicus]